METIKISIGGFAFVLDKKAHQILDDYMYSLSDFYANNVNRDEIIAAIEERIAELLIERGFSNKLVDEFAVNGIIATLGTTDNLGNPYDDLGSVRNRRLYRDLKNNKLSGVCAGLGAYFSVDPVIFRLIFTVGTVLLTLLEFAPLFFPIIYLILYFVMPPAVTAQQRCDMRGEPNSLKGIQSRIESGSSHFSSMVEQASQSSIWRTLARVVGVVLGVAFLIAGIGCSISFVFAFFGVSISWGLFSPFDFTTIVGMFTDAPQWVITVVSVCLFLLLIIPGLMVVYLGIKMIFALKSPKCHPGLIMLVIWFVALFTAFLGSFSTISHLNKIERTYSSSKLPAVDTLFIEFQDCELYKNESIFIDAGKKKFTLAYMVNDEGAGSIITYPHLTINREEDIMNYGRINCSHVNMKAPKTLEEMTGDMNGDYLEIDGNRLILKPTIFKEGESVNRIAERVLLRIDSDVVIITEQPIFHTYEKRFEFSSFPGIIGYMDW
ncbi:MAG: PspC domain-containing protein [Candidatus Coprenecus sp.]|nr:PspC domain-containing protein [Candidatus Coprenecus sp.]